MIKGRPKGIIINNNNNLGALKDFNSNMTLNEFKRYCEEYDDNIVKTFDRTKFNLKCMKCKSEDVKIVNTMSYEIGGGCPTCGSWVEGEGAVIIKCCNCGNAISIMNADENKYR